MALVKRGWTPPEDVFVTQRHWSMESGLRMLKQIGIAPNTVVDLGAAEGSWSSMASQIFTDARYLLCEPLPARKDMLSEISQKSGGMFHFSPIVVGDSKQPLMFDVSGDLDGSGVYGGVTENAVELPQDTLDNLIDEAALPPPYLLKFDTHGYEDNIIRGAVKTLETTIAIVMECYLHQVSPTAKPFWEMCDQLVKVGFRPVYVSDLLARPYDSTLWQMDIFFLRSDHPVFMHSSYQ
ncbi:FkbM family methyltransferase [Aporhodopirellula aestuarii]|nr:FkbM family methyltransferase [Aporhodopirellula aestuarii]